MPVPNPTAQKQSTTRGGSAAGVAMQTRNTFRIAMSILVGSTLSLVPYLYLILRARIWQICVVAGVSVMLGIASATCIVLVRRGRQAVSLPCQAPKAFNNLGRIGAVSMPRAAYDQGTQGVPGFCHTGEVGASLLEHGVW